MPDIQVIEPASTLALTTTARARQLGISEADDVKLNLQIGMASATLERALDRRLARERVLETITTEHPGSIFLSQTPIVTVHAISRGRQLGSLVELESTAWTILNRWTGLVAVSGRPWGGLDIYGYAGVMDPYHGWPADYGYGFREASRAQAVIQVEYTGGYVLPGQTGVSETDPRLMLPLDLEQATIELVRDNQPGGNVDARLTSKRLGDAAWTYAQPGSTTDTLPALVTDVIAAYRRVAL